MVGVELSFENSVYFLVKAHFSIWYGYVSKKAMHCGCAEPSLRCHNSSPSPTYLCLTLSMSAAARLLVLSPSCLLQVGQCSTRPLQGLQIMWPAGQQGMGRSLGMTRHTGHSTTDSRSDTPPPPPPLPSGSLEPSEIVIILVCFLHFKILSIYTFKITLI